MRALITKKSGVNVTDANTEALGLLHDLAGHVTAVTLSMDFMERRVTADSLRLRQYANETARIRKSVEQFAGALREYMKNGASYCLFRPGKEIASVAELFLPIAKESGIEISIESDDSMKLYGNRLKFSQIISNLLSNAMGVMKDSNGRIYIKCRKFKTNIEISVHDTGGGIPLKIQGKIFNPFFTTKKGVTPKFGGIGIGLSSVKKIVEEDFGGTISFVNKKQHDSQGAVFLIKLPHLVRAGRKP